MEAVRKRGRSERRLGQEWAARWQEFYFLESFVGVPFAYMAMNVLLVGLLSLWTVDSNDAAEDCQRLTTQAHRLASYVSTAAISIVTLTFSLTVLSIQIAAQSYSPRLLDDFLKDPVAKVVMSVNLGAYAYCYTLEYWLPRTDDCASEDAVLPVAMIHLLSVHMVAILVSFVEFIHFFINGFRMEKILSRAAGSSLRAAQALSRQYMNSSTMRDTEGGTAAVLGDAHVTLQVPKSAYKVLADKSGYVNSLRLYSILPAAHELDVCVRYTYQIGEYVNEGTVLCYIWDATPPADDDTDDDNTKIPLERRVLEWTDANEQSMGHHPWENLVERKLGHVAARGVQIGRVRSGDLDVTLGIQQLCDIAVRALSQAINDPHTAIQCLNALSDLLARLGLMELGVPSVQDSDGVVRACAPRRSFAFLLSLLDAIRRYGATDLTVCRRGIRLYGDLACILIRGKRIDRVIPVVAQLQQWMLVSRTSFTKDSPELQNLQAVYDHSLDAIQDAEDQLLDEPSVAERDMQFLNTTLPSSQQGLAVQQQLGSISSHWWDDLVQQMESAKKLSSERSQGSIQDGVL
jgi:uncharacterized membrane protein